MNGISTSLLDSIGTSPKMDPGGLRRFESALGDAEVLLEFGAGGSTLFAGRLGVKTIVSVESDAAFMVAVRGAFRERHEEHRLIAHVVDIGPTAEWGYPVDPESHPRWPSYSSSVWLDLRERALDADLVLIDGRFRVACWCRTLANTRPGTIVLFDDYFDRPPYHVVESIVPLHARHDRMAEFHVPSEVDRSALDAMWSQFSKEKF